MTIGIHPYLSKNSIYEHKCPENIKKLYKQAGKCDNKQQFKDITEAAMVSTPEGFTDNSPISPMASSPDKKNKRTKMTVYVYYRFRCEQKNCLPSSWRSKI